MSETVLTKTRIRAGVWEGVLSTEPVEGAVPHLEVVHLEAPVEGISIKADGEVAGQFLVQVPIPIELLSDGVQVFLIRDAESGDQLASFTILTGEPLEEDIRAEMELLRAELDMLKKAFRRHCLETM